MGKAKKYCINMANSKYYKEIKDNLELHQDKVREISDKLYDEINSMKKWIAINSPPRESGEYGKGRTIDKVVTSQIKEYLPALKRHSKSYLKEWYEIVGDSFFE